MYFLLFTLLVFLVSLLGSSAALPAPAPLVNTLIQPPSLSASLGNLSETSLDAIILPQAYIVPSCDLILRYGFEGIPGRRKNIPIDLRFLLDGALTMIQKAMGSRHNANVRISDTTPLQYSLRDTSGLRTWRLVIYHLQPPSNTVEFTLGQVKDVIQAVKHLTVESNQYYEMEFKFYGVDQYGKLRKLGSGRLQEWTR